MKVSVIVPVYNAEKTLVNCLSSLVSQTLDEIEIILVNDCSTDNSLKIMLDCEAQFPEKVLVVNCDVNSGAGGARNAGLMYASGEYIGFVDSDDVAIPEMFEKLYEKAKEGDYDIVDCGHYDEESDVAVIFTSDELAGELNGYKRSELIVSGGYLWSKIYKKSFLDEIGLEFRENCILEDCETIMYTVAKAKNIGNVKEILYIYKYYEKSLSRRLDLHRKFDNMIAAMNAMEKRLLCLENYDEIKEAVEYAIVNFLVLCLGICELDVFAREEKAEKIQIIREYFFKLITIPPKSNKYVINKIKEDEICKLIDVMGEMEIPKVSVIVPVYNAEKTLIPCLSSLIQQTLPEMELILVNDCSTDGSLNILLDCEKQFSERVLVINLDENRGAGGARNVGLMYARGEYIGFVDSDDAVAVEMFEKLYTKAKEGDYDIVDGGFYNEETDIASLFAADELCGKLDDKKRSELIIAGGYFCTKIFKKSFLKEIGLAFRENCILEDCETLMYTFAKAGSIGNIKEILYNYKYYPKSFSRRLDIDKKFINMINTMNAMEKLLFKLDNYGQIQEAIEYSIVNLCVLCMKVACFDEVTHRERLDMFSAIRGNFKKLVKIPLEENHYVMSKIDKEDIDSLKNILDEDDQITLRNDKIAFILCVNNIEEYSETKRYLDNLIVPEGIETDIITIQEASSMCEGYNAGMQATDAKYKVYMHQDVRIINKNFIGGLLEIFKDESVGLIGMVGTRKMSKDAYALMNWDTGKVYYNGDDFAILGYENPDGPYTEVEAVDGLLFATQYDIPFREDVFTDFDFYDISISFEYRLAGKKVVVPHQREPWTYHNDSYSKMSKYDINRKKFLEEYRKDFELDSDIGKSYNSKHEQLIREYAASLEEDIDKRGIKNVADEILSCGISSMRIKDLILLAKIYKTEKGKTIFDWNGGISELYSMLDELKKFLKRVEYDVPMNKDEFEIYCNAYSIYDIVIVASVYCMKLKKIFTVLSDYVPEKEMINNVKNGVSDEFSWKNSMSAFSGINVYNLENWTDERDVPIAIEYVDKESVYKLLDIVTENSLEKRAIVFSLREDGFEKIKNIGIPVICGTPVIIKLYSMEMKWKIDGAYVMGNDSLCEEFRRIYSNSHIKIKD